MNLTFNDYKKIGKVLKEIQYECYESKNRKRANIIGKLRCQLDNAVFDQYPKQAEKEDVFYGDNV